MAQNEAKVKFNADATEFTKAISAASRQIAELQSELRLNTAQMSTMGQSVDTLTQRQKLLTQQAQTLADKKAALVEKLRLAEQYFGADSAEAGRLRTQLNNLETQSVKLEDEIAQTAQALAQQEAAESKVETATERLSNQISQQEKDLADLKRQYSDAVLTYGKTSEEAQDLASQIKALSKELDDNCQAMKYAKTLAEENGDAVDTLSKTIADQESKLEELKRAYANASLEFGKNSDQAQDLASQIKALSKELDDNCQAMKYAKTLAEEEGDAVDALSKIIADQESKLGELKRAYANASLEFGKNSDQAQDLASQIKALSGELDGNKQTLKDAQSETQKCSDRYSVLSDTIKQQAEQLEKLKRQYSSAVLEFGASSKQAKALASDITSLSNDLRQNRTTLDNAESSADKLSQGMEKLGDSLQDTEQDATSLSDIIQGNLIADGIQSLGDAIGDVVESTKEYRTIMASLEVSSQGAGYSAQETAETYRELYGVLDDTQAAATTTANLQAIGLEQSKLSSIIDSTIGAWSRYGDSIQIDGLAESINETIRCGTVTGNLADVLNWGTKEGETFGVTLRANTEANKEWNDAVQDASMAEDYFNLALQNCQTEAERANLIIRTFADQGLTQAGEAWQENNQALIEANQATADQQAVLARLGETATPVMTAVQNGFNRIMTAAADVASTLDTVRIADRIEGVFDFLLANGETVIAVIAGIGTAFASWKVITTVTTVISKIGSLSNLLAMMSNPVGIAAAAIGALVSGFILLYQNVEPFRTAVNGALENLAGIFSSVRDAAGQFFSQAATWFSGLMQQAQPLLSAIGTDLSSGFHTLQNVVGSAVEKLGHLRDLFQPIADLASGALGTAISGLGDLFTTGFLTALENVHDKLGQVQELFVTLAEFGGTLFDNLTPLVTLIRDNLVQAFSGLSEPIQRIYDALSNTLLPALETIGKQFGSWLLPRIKEFAAVLGGVLAISVGNAIGVINGIISAISGFANAVSGVVEIVSNAFNLIAGIFTGDGDRCIQAVQGIWQGVIDVFGGLWSGVSGFLQGFVEGVVGFFQGLWDTLVGHSIVPDTINGIIDCFSGLWDGVSGFVETLVDGVTGAWEGIQNTVGTVAGTIQETVGQRWDNITSVTSNAFRSAGKTASNVWGGVKTTVSNAASNVYSAVSRQWNSIKSTTSSAFNGAKSTASSAWNGLKSTVSNGASNVYSVVSRQWNSIKSTTSTVWNSVRSTASSAWSSIKSTISSGASSALSTVTSKFNSIKSKISSIMSSAKNAVSSAISAIKSKFNFSWKLPKLKLPHVSISGSFSLVPPRVPKFSVSWYKEGGILQAPTIFGASGTTLLGGGEAGPEAVAPIDVLQDYVAAAVERTMVSSMNNLASAIQAMAGRPIYLQVNGRTFALATAGDTDDALGTRQALTARGLCL